METTSPIETKEPLTQVGELTEKLFNELFDIIKKPENSSLQSAVDIITFSLKFLDKFSGLSLNDKIKIIMSAIERLAAGADGIAGTSDDLIPKEYIQLIKDLLKPERLLTTVIELISSPKYSEIRQDIKEEIVETVQEIKSSSCCLPFCGRKNKKLDNKI
jgi:hypothetical protein